MVEQRQMTLPADDPEKYLSECTKIEPVAIDEEFIRTPSDVAFWNARFADALEVYLKAKAHMETEWARLRLLTREELLAKGEKATESAIDNNTEVRPEWAAARLTFIEAEVQKARIAGSCEAVRTKKEMLQSLGAKLRIEMGSDPMVRAEQAAASGAARGR